MNTRALRGLIAASTTPLTPALDPDPSGLVRHCRELLRRGCDAVLCLGTTGEANSFTVEERLTLIDELGRAGLGPSVMLGIGCCAFPDTLRLARHALSQGICHLLWLPPFYYRGVSDEGLLSALSRIIEPLDRGRAALYLYHIPQLSGVPITDGLLRAARERYPDTIVGVKDSGGDWAHTAGLMQGHPELAVFSGTEAHLLASRRLGGPGCISATFNVTAELAAELDRDWQGPGAERRLARLVALRQVLAHRVMIPALKAALARRTGEAGWRRVRPPLVSLAPEEGESLWQELVQEGLDQ